MPSLFTYIPAKSFSKTTKTNSHQIKFGEGYSQRVSEGINNIASSWELSFINVSLTTSANIESFLTARNGTEAFLFNPPGELITYLVICTEWSTEYTSHISRTIKCNFEQVFDL
jgi:phage-related protein